METKRFDTEQLKQFGELLKILMGNSEHGYFHAFDENAINKTSPNSKRIIPIKKGKSLPISRIPDGDWHVYFGVLPLRHAVSKKPSRKEDVISELTCFWRDYDLSDELQTRDELKHHLAYELELPPSAMISSGNGVHCYWLLDEPVSAERFGSLQVELRLKQWVKMSKADRAASDLVRSLRVPGTLNYKNNPPAPVTFEFFDPDLRYSYEQIATICDKWQDAQPKPPPRQKLDYTIPESVAEKIVWAAVDGICARIAAQRQPGRHNIINWGAYRAGQYLHHAPSLYSNIEAALRDAAVQNGEMGENEAGTLRTIDEGLRDGQSDPKDLEIMQKEDAPYQEPPQARTYQSPSTEAAIIWLAMKFYFAMIIID